MITEIQPSMLEIAAPPLRDSTWICSLIERHDIGGTRLYSVTIREGIGPARRRWFPTHLAARCFGLDQADALGLPLIDMSGGAATE